MYYHCNMRFRKLAVQCTECFRFQLNKFAKFRIPTVKSVVQVCALIYNTKTCILDIFNQFTLLNNPVH